MHSRQHFLHAHIDKALRTKLKLTKRTVQISKGDTVKIMTGSKKGSIGKVIAVDLRTGRIQLDSLSRKSMKGKELKLRIYVSNVYITELNLSDKFRAAKLKVAPVPIQKPKVEEKKAEPAAPTPKAEAAHAHTHTHEAPSTVTTSNVINK